MSAAVLSATGNDLRFKALPEAPFVFPPRPSQNVKACPPRKSLSVNSVTSAYSRNGRTLSNSSSVYSGKLEPVKPSVVVTESMIDDIVLFTNVQAEQYAASISPASSSNSSNSSNEHGFFPVEGQAFSAARPSSSSARSSHSSPRRLSPSASRLSSAESSISPSPSASSIPHLSSIRDSPSPAPEVPLPPIPRQTSAASALNRLQIQSEESESQVLNRRPVPPPKEYSRSPITPSGASSPFSRRLLKENNLLREKSLPRQRQRQPQKAQFKEQQTQKEPSSTFPVNPASRKPVPPPHDSVPASVPVSDMGNCLSPMENSEEPPEQPPQLTSAIPPPHQLQKDPGTELRYNVPNGLNDQDLLLIYGDQSNGWGGSYTALSDMSAPTPPKNSKKKDGLGRQLLSKARKAVKSKDDENSTPDAPPKPTTMSRLRQFVSSSGEAAVAAPQTEATTVPTSSILPYPGSQEVLSPSRSAQPSAATGSEVNVQVPSIRGTDDSGSTVRPSATFARGNASPGSRPTTANSALTAESDQSHIHPAFRNQEANTSTDTLVQSARRVSPGHARQAQFGNNYITSPRSRTDSGAALAAVNRPQRPQLGDNSTNGSRSRTNSDGRLLNTGYNSSQTDLSLQNNIRSRSSQPDSQQQDRSDNLDTPRSRANSGAGVQQQQGAAVGVPRRPVPTPQHSGTNTPDGQRSRANSAVERPNPITSNQEMMGSNLSTPRPRRGQQSSAGVSSNAPRSRANSNATQIGPSGNNVVEDNFPTPRPPQAPYDPNNSRSRSTSINSRYGSANNSRANSLRNGPPPPNPGFGNNQLPQQQPPRIMMARIEYPMQRPGEPDPQLMVFLASKKNPFNNTPYAIQQKQIAANPNAHFPNLIQEEINDANHPNLFMFRCSKNHGMSKPGRDNSLRSSNNKVNPLSCAMCRVRDKEDRFYCYNCDLRCCLECKRRLESCDGNLKNVMQGLGRGSVFREATKKEISRVLADEGNWDNEEVYKKSKKKKEDSYRQQQERLDALVIGDATVEVEKCDNDDKDTTKADEKTKKDRKDIPGSFPRN